MAQKNSQTAKQLSSLLAASFSSETVKALCSDATPLKDDMQVMISRRHRGFSIGTVISLANDECVVVGFPDPDLTLMIL